MNLEIKKYMLIWDSVNLLEVKQKENVAPNQGAWTIKEAPVSTSKQAFHFRTKQVKKAADEVNPNLVCMACGSYRRGKVTCGDVDVLVTHPDGKSHKGVFTHLLNNLRESGRIL